MQGAIGDNNQSSDTFLQALEIVDHDSENLHDIEIQQGMATALCMHMDQVWNNGDLETNHQSSRIILHILSSTFKCSDSVREKTFRDLGTTFVPYILSVMESIWSPCVRDSSCASVFFAMEIIRSFSRLQSASLEFMRNARLMSLLENLISGSVSEYFISLRVGALAILKNISFYAEDFRFEILERRSLIEAVLIAAIRRDGDESREYASAILRNLAMAPDTKEEMVVFPVLLEAIVSLLSDPNPKTRRNAVSAIGSISIAEDNSLILVLHGDGAILNILLRLMRFDDDYVIRRRAARALKLIGRRDTVEMLVNYHGMIEALTDVAINDANWETQIEATETLACYASHLQETVGCSETIIHSLLKICTRTTQSACLEIVLKVVKELTLNQDNLSYMMNISSFLPTIISVIRKSSATNAVVEHASGALFNISKNPEQRSKMASRQVFSALAFIASKNSEIPQAQMSAVGTIVNLATVPESRKCMATEMGLLKSLMQYATRTQDLELKNDVKSAIMVLIPAL